MKYVAEWCPICDQGWVLIVKEIKAGLFYFCCEECEAEWNINDQITNTTCLPFDMYGKYEFFTEEELRKNGLDKYVIKEIPN